MNANLKGAIVMKLVDEKTKREAVVRLDKSRMMFFCTIGEETKKSTNGNEVESWAKTELRKTTSEMRLTWVPVLEALVEHGDRYGFRSRDGKQGQQEAVKFSVDRYYVAKAREDARGETWVRLHWAECDADSPTRLDEDVMYSQATDFRKPSENMYERADEKKKVIFRLPSRGGEHEMRYYLPYTPELWEASLQVVKMLTDVRTTLDALFGTKKGIEHLLGGGGNLRLTAGPKS